MACFDTVSTVPVNAGSPSDWMPAATATTSHTVETIRALYDDRDPASGHPISEHTSQWRAGIARAIIDRDAPALKVLANGMNPTSLAIFCEVAGIKAPKTQRAQWAAIKAFCGYSDEAEAQAISARRKELDAQAAARELEHSARTAEYVHVKSATGVVTGRQWVDQSFADGWTKITSWKRGAATSYGLAKPEDPHRSLCMNGKGWSAIARYARAKAAALNVKSA